MPQCVGAVDSCHVPISFPAKNRTDYYNQKGWYSMSVVDHSYCFIDVNVGWPGSVHDACVFAHSSIYKNKNENNLLPDKRMTSKYSPVFSW